MKTTFTFLLGLIGLNLSAQAPAIEWQKCLGGTNIDIGTSIKQTTDGGYIIAGTTRSSNGDVTLNNGQNDIWVVKLNANNSIAWQKTYGGIYRDGALSISQTIDSGYIIAGFTNYIDGLSDSGDLYVLKINDIGTMQWEKTYGGTKRESARSVSPTSDGGYIVAGWTESNDGDIKLFQGNRDMWVLKLNELGIIQWQKTFGGSDIDEAESVQQTTDGGFIVGGPTRSIDGDLANNLGITGFWVLKLNNMGDIQWNKTYVEGFNLNSIQQTTDNGYILGGSAAQSNEDTDFSLVKLDHLGVLQWHKTFGGSQDDWAYSVKQTQDGGYIIGGETESNNGDVTLNQGFYDSWVVKTDSNGILQWQKSFGGNSDEAILDVIQTLDGSYVTVGFTFSTNGHVTGNHGSTDVWVVKLFPDNLSNHEVSLPENVSVFPNPTKDFFTIFSKGDIKKVELFDIKGLKIYESIYVKDQVSLENFSKGVYVLKIYLENGGIITEKIIKE